MRKTILAFVISALCVSFTVPVMAHETTSKKKVTQSATSKIDIININTAEAADLVLLPGIGKVKAAAIVRYRKENGKFTSLDDLTNVDGIGKASARKIAPMITFE